LAAHALEDLADADDRRAALLPDVPVQEAVVHPHRVARPGLEAQERADAAHRGGVAARVVGVVPRDAGSGHDRVCPVGDAPPHPVHEAAQPVGERPRPLDAHDRGAGAGQFVRADAHGNVVAHHPQQLRVGERFRRVARAVERGAGLRSGHGRERLPLDAEPPQRLVAGPVGQRAVLPQRLDQRAGVDHAPGVALRQRGGWASPVHPLEGQIIEDVAPIRARAPIQGHPRGAEVRDEVRILGRRRRVVHDADGPALDQRDDLTIRPLPHRLVGRRPRAHLQQRGHEVRRDVQRPVGPFHRGERVEVRGQEERRHVQVQAPPGGVRDVGHGRAPSVPGEQGELPDRVGRRLVVQQPPVIELRQREVERRGQDLDRGRSPAVQVVQLRLSLALLSYEGDQLVDRHRPGAGLPPLGEEPGALEQGGGLGVQPEA